MLCKIIKVLEEKTYQDWLQEFNVYRLEQRRKMGDMNEPFKYLKGVKKVLEGGIFSMRPWSNTQGHLHSPLSFVPRLPSPLLLFPNSPHSFSTYEHVWLGTSLFAHHFFVILLIFDKLLCGFPWYFQWIAPSCTLWYAYVFALKLKKKNLLLKKTQGNDLSEVKLITNHRKNLFLLKYG